jgi:hypothetical protein
MTTRTKEKYNTALDMLRFRIQNLIDDFNDCKLNDIECEIEKRQTEIEERSYDDNLVLTENMKKEYKINHNDCEELNASKIELDVEKIGEMK